MKDFFVRIYGAPLKGDLHILAIFGKSHKYSVEQVDR